MLRPFDRDEYIDSNDPWGYETNQFDTIRLDWLLAYTHKIPRRRILDVGAGQGFIARKLKSEEYLGLDISPTSTKLLSNFFESQGWSTTHKALCGSILNAETLELGRFDLIIATGVFYEHYLGDNLRQLERQLDFVSEIESYLVTVHIKEWKTLVPTRNYVEIDRWCYPYREFTHELIVQRKIK